MSSYREAILEVARQSGRQIPPELLIWTELMDSSPSLTTSTLPDADAWAAFGSFKQFVDWIQSNRVPLTSALPSELLLRIVEILIRLNHFQPEDVESLIRVDKSMWSVVTRYAQRIWMLLIQTNFPTFKWDEIDRFAETAASLKARFFALRYGRQIWTTFTTPSSHTLSFDETNAIQSIGNDPNSLRSRSLLEIFAEDEEILPNIAEFIEKHYMKWIPTEREPEEMNDVRLDIVYRMMDDISAANLLRVIQEQRIQQIGDVAAPHANRLLTLYGNIDANETPHTLVSVWLAAHHDDLLISDPNLASRRRQEVVDFAKHLFNMGVNLMDIRLLLADLEFHRLLLDLGSSFQ